MSNQPGVSAEGSVVRGGNRTVAVRVPVVSYDQFGGVWWEGDAVANLQIPQGAKVPEFSVPADGVVTAEVVTTATAALAEASTELNFTPVFKGHVQCFGPDGVLKWEDTFTTSGAASVPLVPVEFKVTGVDDGGH